MALEGNELEEVMKSLPNWSYEREESRSIIKRSLIFQGKLLFSFNYVYFIDNAYLFIYLYIK